MFYSEFEELDEKDINKFICYAYNDSRNYNWCPYTYNYKHSKYNDSRSLADRINELSEHYLKPPLK